MAAAISLEMDVSALDIVAFKRAISDYQRKTQRDMRGTLRSATIDLCRSLRAQTRRAPKLVERDDVRWAGEMPKYYTGAKDGKLYKRVIVSRWAKGKRKQSVHWQEVESKERVRKGATVHVEASAQMLREARTRFGKIRMWGLAKKSWGWFMHSLFGKAVKNENPSARLTSGMVDGAMTEKRTPLPDGTIDLQAPIRCEITIINKLEYIRRAMNAGALAIAIKKATNYIRGKIKRGVQSRKFGAGK